MLDHNWQLYNYERRERLAVAARFRLLKTEDGAPLHWRLLARLGQSLVANGSRIQARCQAEGDALCMPTPLPRVSRSYTTK